MPSILLIGATGLIGQAVLALFAVKENNFEIRALTRRDHVSFDSKKNIVRHIVDFDRLEDFKENIIGDILVCALGTTIRKAGTKEKFYQVDHDYPLTLAKLAIENGARKMILVSSVGADPKARNYYLQTKGRLEKDLEALPFEELHILRPSLLMGKREEFRPAEEIAKKIARVTTFFTPAKYKPIYAQQLAAAAYAVARQGEKGTHVYEGKRLRALI